MLSFNRNSITANKKWFVRLPPAGTTVDYINVSVTRFMLFGRMPQIASLGHDDFHVYCERRSTGALPEVNIY